MAKRICIDAGHGGSDPGAKNGTYKEKNAALGIAFELGLVLYRGGYEVYFTRTNDTAVSLADRCTISNLAGADLFVSVHLNSSTSASAAGIETYVYRNASATARNVADNVQKKLIEATGSKNRGVKESGFYVLKNTKSPAILVETGFISNTTECKKLFTTDYQRTLAKAIYGGIRQVVK
ncbi:MAG: N-acetylmuramoyl-L-alanine amidase [Fibrobacter sp.]|nr:N-acetylmuramoyl-L-alanine amidase [Fibrobacter sp.]MBQ6770485.1 N-acetylmuramoyl-L-alanine amidase [Bacteroidales bacterium]